MWIINVGKNHKFAINGRTGVTACLLMNGFKKEKLIFDNYGKKIIRNKDIDYEKTKIEKIANVVLMIICIIVISAIILNIFR